MAIGYARATPIQRSKGRSTVQRLAYLLRTEMRDARTGLLFDFRHRQDLISSFTVLPAGCADSAGGAPALWNAVEKASARRDAALGIELLLALPMPAECPVAVSQAMVELFVRTVIVDKHHLAATVAVHAPHDTHTEGDEDDATSRDDDAFAQAMSAGSANLHAHILISPRQLTALGLSRRRYTALDPVTRNGRTVGRNWGRLWRHFQNAYFTSIGFELRVAPNPPIDLVPVPLQVVRRWRRRMLRANPAVNGRKLLVNAERERSNRDIVETLEGAMACFEQPFTENELAAFYRRHLPTELARELTSATIGLGYCVEIASAGALRKWYASIYQIHDELAVFGRAVLLSARFETAVDVSDFVREGFPARTKRLLVDLFSGADLVMIKAAENPTTLVTDMARLAQTAGLMPVSVVTAAGHALADCVVRTVADLSGRMASKALLIIDDADALTPKELALVLAAGVAGGNKVALIRRADTDWPRLDLLALIGKHVSTLEWPGGLSHVGHAPRTTGILERALAAAQRENAITWFETSHEVRRMMPDLGLQLPMMGSVTVGFDGEAAVIVVASPLPESDDLRRRNATGPTGLPAIAAAFARFAPTNSTAIRFVVARDHAPTVDALADILAREHPNSAISHSAHGHLQSSSEWPRLAVDPDGVLVTHPANIARSIWLTSTLTDQLRWTVKGRSRQRDYDKLQELLNSWVVANQTRLSDAGLTKDEINFLDYVPSIEPMELDHENAALATLLGWNTDAVGDEATDHDPDATIEDDPEFDDDWGDGTDPDGPEEP